MFRKTPPPQPEMFGIESLIGSKKMERLEGSWAGSFRREILPLIDEERFAEFYDPEQGSPNTSVRMLVGMLYIKDMDDLTDREILEHLEWHAQVQYALGVEPHEAHVSRKTLYSFRTNVMNSGKGQTLFDDIANGIQKLGNVKLGRQRTDSAHIVSNMMRLERLGLFVKTIEQFLKALKRLDEKKLESLPERFFERYIEREGYFADSRSSRAKRRLGACAKDVWYLIDRFREEPEITETQQYRTLVRLFAEQCEVAPGDEPPEERVALRDGKDIPSDSMQSPSDPDATYGHKGKGYEVQVTETCDERNELQLITDVAVTPSNGSDQKELIPAIERLEEAGRKPETMIGDGGYVSGENIVEAHGRGVDLQGPVGGAAAHEEKINLGDFTYTEDGELEKCPAGHEPEYQEPSRKGDGINAYFDLGHCNLCERNEECIGFKTKSHRRIFYNAARVATAMRQRQQATTEFKEAYKIRSGIEATNSELKRRHGMGRLRIRGRPQVELAIYLKTSACNIKRYLAYALKKATEGLRPAQGTI